LDCSKGSGKGGSARQARRRWSRTSGESSRGDGRDSSFSGREEGRSWIPDITFREEYDPEWRYDFCMALKNVEDVQHLIQ
jgi:hypothetical protein